MISFVNHTNETLIYLDNEGIDELVQYLEYLKKQNDAKYDLVIGNELDKLDEDIMPEGGYANVTYVGIINLDNLK